MDDGIARVEQFDGAGCCVAVFIMGRGVPERTPGADIRPVKPGLDDTRQCCPLHDSIINGDFCRATEGVRIEQTGAEIQFMFRNCGSHFREEFGLEGGEFFQHDVRTKQKMSAVPEAAGGNKFLGFGRVGLFEKFRDRKSGSVNGFSGGNIPVSSRGEAGHDAEGHDGAIVGGRDGISYAGDKAGRVVDHVIGCEDEREIAGSTLLQNDRCSGDGGC